MVLLNNVFLSPDGFMFKILQFDKICIDCNLKYQAVFSPVIKVPQIYFLYLLYFNHSNLAKALKRQ